MTPYKRKYDKAYAKVLLRIATQELETVLALAAKPVGRPETTCFLAQQVVEKALKAVICHFEKPVPLIHDISGLLACLPDSCDRPPSDSALVGLSEYATVRRYEEGPYQLSQAEVTRTAKVAEEIVAWARDKID